MRELLKIVSKLLLLVMLLALGGMLITSCSNQEADNSILARNAVKPHPKVKSASNMEPSKAKPGQGTNSKQNAIHVNPADIQWMTLQSDLIINPYTHKVLFKGNAPDTLNRVAGMINAAKNQRPSEVEEWWGAGKARSGALLISLKDGSRIRVGHSYKVLESKNSRNNSESCRPYDDRVIIYWQNKKITADSKELVNYLKKQAAQDMPLVPCAVADKESYVPGQSITISGDGCRLPKVRIYLENAIGVIGSERYLVAEVPAVFGKWKWSGLLGREFITLEGTHIKLHKGTYNFYVITGDYGEIAAAIQKSYSVSATFDVK